MFLGVCIPNEVKFSLPSVPVVCYICSAQNQLPLPLHQSVLVGLYQAAFFVFLERQKPLYREELHL